MCNANTTEDSAVIATPSIFFAGSLDDRSNTQKQIMSALKVLLIAASIVAVPLFKDSLSHFLQHVSAQAFHIDETFTGIMLGLATKIPELSKLFARHSN